MRIRKDQRSKINGLERLRNTCVPYQRHHRRWLISQWEHRGKGRRIHHRRLQGQRTCRLDQLREETLQWEHLHLIPLFIAFPRQWIFLTAILIRHRQAHFNQWSVGFDGMGTFYCGMECIPFVRFVFDTFVVQSTQIETENGSAIYSSNFTVHSPLPYPLLNQHISLFLVLRCNILRYKIWMSTSSISL